MSLGVPGLVRTSKSLNLMDPGYFVVSSRYGRAGRNVC